MTKKQILLQLREGTETQLRTLRSSEHDDYSQLAAEWSTRDAISMAGRLKDLSGVLSPLDLGLAMYGLKKLCN